MPIGYWSWTLIPAKLNYSTTERECLGAVLAVLHLRVYLERMCFTVRTDHHALRWALLLAKDEFNFSFRKRIVRSLARSAAAAS